MAITLEKLLPLLTVLIAMTPAPAAASEIALTELQTKGTFENAGERGMETRKLLLLK
ncbi:MAG: hypothetical protein HOC74_19155 [Gemmatimonadetes bacterium]|nr:hypothetical protein [Gemmatimonadota bacterium]